MGDVLFIEGSEHDVALEASRFNRPPYRKNSLTEDDVRRLLAKTYPARFGEQNDNQDLRQGGTGDR